MINASPSRARAAAMVADYPVIEPEDPRRLHVRSDHKGRSTRTSAGTRMFTEQWQSDLRSCMRAMDSTLTHLTRSIAEGQMLTARSEARCLSKQAHTLDALLVPCPDVTL